MPVDYQSILGEIAAQNTAQASLPLWQIVLYVVVPFALAIIAILSFLVLIRKKSKESVVLTFIGEDVAEINRPVIQSKRFSLGMKTYDLGKVKPLHFRDGIWGTKPFYMIHEDTPVSLFLDREEKKIKISSGTYKDAIENSTLKDFLTMKTSNEGMIMGIAIGVVVGVILAVIGYATKVIKP